MAMPGHYCVLTSSDKVNEESTSGRMVGETKNGRAPSFERRGFYGPQHRHVPRLISAATLPTCIILICRLIVLKHLA